MTKESLPPFYPSLPLFFLCHPSLTESAHPRLHALTYKSGVNNPGNPPLLFPPDLSPCILAENPTGSMLAIGCNEGQILLLDVSMLFR